MSEPEDVLAEMQAGPEPAPEVEDEQPKVWISVEVEAGIHEDWQACGLDEPPADAAALLAKVQDENDSIHEFIRDWDLLSFVSVTVSVRRQNDKGRWDNTHATWTEP